MRTGGGLAIAIGALVGVALAFARRGAEPPAPVRPVPIVKSIQKPLDNAAPTELLVPSELPAPDLPASDSSTPSGPPPPPADSAPAPAGPAPSPAPAGPAAAPGPAPAPAFPMPAALPPPASLKELERVEVRCYDKRPDDCERAAAAYEAGLFSAPDSARAEKLRKVALTFLVRGCEKRSPHACYVLGSRYQTGAGVAQSTRKALALLEHARELCRNKPGPECTAGEPR